MRTIDPSSFPNSSVQRMQNKGRTSINRKVSLEEHESVPSSRGLVKGSKSAQRGLSWRRIQVSNFSSNDNPNTSSLLTRNIHPRYESAARSAIVVPSANEVSDSSLERIIKFNQQMKE